MHTKVNSNLVNILCMSLIHYEIQITATTAVKSKPTQGNCWISKLVYFTDDDGNWVLKMMIGVILLVFHLVELKLLTIHNCLYFTNDDGKWDVENDNWCCITSNNTIIC
ncbi:hypothetical protein H8356DRAFT_1350862 [Neocallimastix lanati (nom. inval.)]|nr:hypothetical protein H8356DRAFT_1350862 [Neocallimastix sp. JGI-2020a]